MQNMQNMPHMPNLVVKCLAQNVLLDALAVWVG